MDLTDRQKSLLLTIIREYIDSAVPVSSKLIEKKYDFEVCPATIRNDMYKLAEEGFLFQPHISAGRVPTDRGYRFFVNQMLEREMSDSAEEIRNMEQLLEKERKDTVRLISNLTRFLATRSSGLAITHLLNRDFFWKEGWEQILNEPEFKEGEVLSEFTDFMRRFEKKIKGLEVNSSIRVYIGRENPFGRTRSFSFIVTKCRFPGREKATLSLIGPKRMPYQKNLSLMNSIIKLLNDF